MPNPDLLEPAVSGKQRQHPQHHLHAPPGGKSGRKLPLDEATAAAASMNGLTVDLESVLGLQGRNRITTNHIQKYNYHHTIWF